MLRLCGRCKRKKPLEDFAWRRIDKGWRDNYCRGCRSAYKKEHYARNKERYKANARAHARIRIPERIALLEEYLSSHPCMDCGEADLTVLEFDHLREKSFDLGQGFRNFKWSRVLQEISKCEVV
jgi:hypothetical protein